MKKIIDGRNKISGFRLYQSPSARNKAISALRRIGRNYFTCYKDSDTEYPYGLGFAVSLWVKTGYHINR